MLVCPSVMRLDDPRSQAAKTSTAETGRRFVRVALLLVGALVVAFAVSDHPLYGGEPGFGRTQVLMAAAGVGLALCGLLPTGIARRILVFSVSSLCMLAFVEIAGEAVFGPRYRPIFQYDDRLIFKFVPNRRSSMTRSPLNGGETVTQRINSDGFCGDELRPTGQVTRVVVYGDSFIHAFYSRQEETFTSQLRALLAERLGRAVEVVNAGVSSYGPDQVSLKMEDELPRLRPDLVVVAIFVGNDYGDLMRNKLFRLGADGELVESPWKLDPKVRVRLDLSQQESILKRILGVVFGSKPPLQPYEDMGFLLAEAEREYQSFVVERNNVITNTHQDYYSANVSLTPGSASAQYEVALMRAVVRRVRDVAARSAVPLAFLVIPHPFDVTDHYDGWRVDRERFPDYDGRNQSAALEDMLRTLAVPFVSLYDVYRAKDANSLYFHGGDDHWNAAGQRLAAEVMADYLLARGLPGSGKAAAVEPK